MLLVLPGWFHYLMLETTLTSLQEAAIELACKQTESVRALLEYGTADNANNLQLSCALTSIYCEPRDFAEITNARQLHAVGLFKVSEKCRKVPRGEESDYADDSSYRSSSDKEEFQASPNNFRYG